MRKTLLLGAALLGAVSASSAQAAVNLVVNGGFELGVAPAGETVLPTGDITSLTGWRVLSNGVTYVDDSVWDASEGDRSIELNTDNVRGGILQRVYGFTPGYRYQFSYDVSANPFDPNPRPKSARVNATMSGGIGGIYAYTLNNVNTATNMLYDTVTYTFVADSTFLNLQIRSLTAGVYGPVIDNVTVSVIPEASTWAMLVAGFGLVGLASRRRNRASVTA